VTFLLKTYDRSTEKLDSRLKPILDILPNIACGDFSRRLDIPSEDDDLTKLYVGINCMLEDLDENFKNREKIEKALRESEKKYRELVETSKDMIFKIDREGNLLFTNKSWGKRLGFSKDHEKKMNVFDLIHSEDLKVTIEQFGRVLGGQNIENLEFRSKTKNGSFITILVNASPIFDSLGNVIAILGIARDITKLKQFEEELKGSEERLKIIFEYAPDAYYLSDFEGNFIDENKAAEELIGYKREELIGKNFLDLGLLSPDYFEKAVEGLAKNVAGEPTGPDEFVLNRKDGQQLPVEIRTYPVNIRGQDLTLGIARDITERKQVEGKLKETVAELKRTNADLEQIIKVAYHDLQEPLRTVSSYVQLLKRNYKGKLDKDADEFIGYTVDGVNRMHRLISDLLTYLNAGTKDKPFESVDTSNVIDNVVASLRKIIDETGAVITYDPLPIVVADNLQLFQLSKNLISNAIKFHGEESPRIHISARQRENEWLFSVHDNGIGIGPEFHGRIFNLFQRLHNGNEYPGTGIGLAISKKIVENHGGQIWVESESGRGSTFYFTIPKRRGEKT